MIIPLWRKIQKKNFVRIEPLLDFLELSPDLRSQVLARPRFVLNLPERLAAKIEKNTLADPILRQFLPLVQELEPNIHFSADPVQDTSFRETPKLLHKYPGRALLVTTKACAMNCRFCFRQNFPYETEEKGFEAELAHIAQDPSLSEIILSGGDPLSLDDATLSPLLAALDAIPHIKRLRFHSRFPIGIPERIDDSFLRLLASYSKQIFFIVHVNHPRELDTDVLFALKKIQKLGIPVLNQSVLLKGVNDDEETLRTLLQTLVNHGIVPYYLHHLDPVQGAGHFQVPPERAASLIRQAQETLSGYAVPRLAREEPGMSSKTFAIFP